MEDRFGYGAIVRAMRPEEREVNCAPNLGHRNQDSEARFLMAENLACRHDISIKEKVAEMVDAGMGWDSISSRLAISRSTVKQWVMTYRRPERTGC